MNMKVKSRDSLKRKANKLELERKVDKRRTFIYTILLCVVMCSLNTFFLISTYVNSVSSYIWMAKIFCYFTWSSLFVTALYFLRTRLRKESNLYDFTFSVVAASASVVVAVFIDFYCILLVDVHRDLYISFFDYFISYIMKLSVLNSLLYCGIFAASFIATFSLSHIFSTEMKILKEFKERRAKANGIKVDTFNTLTVMADVLSGNETPFIVAVGNENTNEINVIMTGTDEDRKALLRCVLKSFLKTNKQQGIEQGEAFDDIISMSANALGAVYNEEKVNDFDFNNYLEGD